MTLALWLERVFDGGQRGHDAGVVGDLEPSSESGTLKSTRMKTCLLFSSMSLMESLDMGDRLPNEQ